MRKVGEKIYLGHSAASSGRVRRRSILRWSRLLVLPVTLILLLAQTVAAQQPSKPSSEERELIKQLQKEVAELKARLQTVEGKQVQTEEQVATVTSKAAETAQKSEYGLDSLQIRGFGDITYTYFDEREGDRNRFTLGEFALFLQTQLSENVSVVGDLEFEAELEDREFEVEVSRLMLEYEPSRYFNLAAGRYFSHLSYYANHYPHGAWTQSTIQRPFLVDEETSPLPVRGLGVSLTGAIPSGKLGLHYFAEVSNGRSANPHHEEGEDRIESDISSSADVFDGKNGKAFTVGLYARPEWVPSLQVGAGLYYDRVRFRGAEEEEGEEEEHEEFHGRMEQKIISAHLVYDTPTFEWLNEAFLFLHNPNRARSTHPVGFYSQFSQQFGQFRPYFRYEYFNASGGDPAFRHIGRQHGPTLGVRYDLTTFAAVKLQYDRLWQRGRGGTNGLRAQVAFAF